MSKIHLLSKDELSNIDVLERLSDSNGSLTYNGTVISGIAVEDICTRSEVIKFLTNKANIDHSHEELHNHANNDVLSGISEIGGVLAYKGNPLEQNNSSYPTSITQKTILNAVNGSERAFIDDNNSYGKVIINAYKYVQGDDNVVQTLKEFNNANKENFIYNEDNVDFSQGMTLKDTYAFECSLLDPNGIYISETIDLDSFISIDGMEV